MQLHTKHRRTLKYCSFYSFGNGFLGVLSNFFFEPKQKMRRHPLALALFLLFLERLEPYSCAIGENVTVVMPGRNWIRENRENRRLPSLTYPTAPPFIFLCEIAAMSLKCPKLFRKEPLRGIKSATRIWSERAAVRSKATIFGFEVNNE